MRRVEEAREAVDPRLLGHHGPGVAPRSDDDAREALGAFLTDLGVEPAAVSTWFCGRDPVAVRLRIEELFVKTPGAQTGAAVWAGG